MNIDFIEMRTVVVITKTVGGCVNIILYSFSNISIPTKQSQRSVITESGTNCRKKRMQPLHNRKAGTRIQSYVRLPAHACHAKSSLHGNEVLPCRRSLPSNPAGNKLRRRLPIVLYRFYSCLLYTSEINYGKNTYILEEGDSIYYDSIVAHHVHAAADNTAKILGVIYTPY